MGEDRIDNAGLTQEEVPSLIDFAEEPGGAWPKGWYSATVIEGYATRKGKVFSTTDEPSRNLDSRNLFICFTINNGRETRNFRTNLNYRETDFTPERLETIKELREQFRGTRGAWPGYADIQRSSLAIAGLGQLEKAVGFRLQRTQAGHLSAAPFVGQKLDIRLGIDEKGYNEVTAFAKAGSRTTKAQAF